MRYTLLILLLVLVGIAALSSWRPGIATSLPTLTPTLLPDNFTLLPTFVPAFPCEMQNVEVREEHDQFCWNERVTENVLAHGDGVQFIQHDYHKGSGCWGSISQDIHELRVCSQSSGAITTLTTELTSALLPSPDGVWLLYGTMNPISTRGAALLPHVWRVRFDGTGMQQLDTQGFPHGLVGAPLDLRWLDDDWVALKLWDAAGNDESNYHRFRLKADGSGTYEALQTEAST